MKSANISLLETCVFELKQNRNDYKQLDFIYMLQAGHFTFFKNL